MGTTDNAESDTGSRGFMMPSRRWLHGIRPTRRGSERCTAHHRRRWDDYQPGEHLRRHSDLPRDLGAAVGIKSRASEVPVLNELAIALRSRVPSCQILTMLYRPSPGAAWPAAIIAWGPGFTSTVHAHHSLQLVMSMEGSLLVCGGPHEEWRRCGAALIRPDAVHAVDAHRGTVLIAFIEAESQLGAILCERIEGDIACVGRRQVANWRDTLGSPPSNAGVKRWVDGFFLHRRSVVPGDLRVLRVLTYMRERLGTARDLSLQALAAIAGVSRSRFMHIFTASVGRAPFADMSSDARRDTLLHRLANEDKQRRCVPIRLNRTGERVRSGTNDYCRAPPTSRPGFPSSTAARTSSSSAPYRSTQRHISATGLFSERPSGVRLYSTLGGTWE